jgi:hypothetical protein
LLGKDELGASEGKEGKDGETCFHDEQLNPVLIQTHARRG